MRKYASVAEGAQMEKLFYVKGVGTECTGGCLNRKCGKYGMCDA